jgi:hypothetical protein
MTPTITMFFTFAISAVIIVLLVYFIYKPTIRNVMIAPSILAGLGIFGTFLGITIGLMHFNANNIVGSVPVFLSGIKLAFWSSVVGILASLIHKLRFTIFPLQENYVLDELESTTVESLKSMTRSLTNIEKMGANDNRNAVINELGEFIRSFGKKLEAGLFTAPREDKDYISTDRIKMNEALLSSLNNLKEELIQSLAEQRSDVQEQTQRLLDELKEDTVAGRKQSESLLETLTGLKQKNTAEDKVVALALKELNEELAKSSAMQSENLLGALANLRESNKGEDATVASTLNELKELNETQAKNLAMQSESLLDALAGMQENNKAQDETVASALYELKALNEAQVKDSATQTESLLDALASLKESHKAEDEILVSALKELNAAQAKNAAIQAESILNAFAGLKETLGTGSEEERKVSREQMEELFAGLTRAAAGTLGELSEISDNLISQAKWQAVNLAKEISSASEVSAKSMLSMLKDILGETQDSNLKITAELAKLRGDVAADLRVTTEQSAALVKQLHAMTESYKASLISTVTDLKAQISKDMKANYNLIDTYTKAVADVTGTNQVEALERMEAIANIMQNVVQSSADMSDLLHENAAAINSMKDTFTGTNEGSLGRFLLNMNQDLIEHITSLQQSLDAQGSLGTLMQDMNAETNLQLKGLEKSFEGSVYEIKQLPQQFVKGISKQLELMNGRKK